VGAIANEAQIPGKAIGQIEIKETYSFVEVPENVLQRVVSALSRSRIRGREVRVEVARPREEPVGAGTRRPPASQLAPLRPDKPRREARS
jgi:ATP-dependent RNA helicase DeaD